MCLCAKDDGIVDEDDAFAFAFVYDKSGDSSKINKTTTAAQKKGERESGKKLND